MRRIGEGRPLTIVDVARLAGVSKSTVARALAGDRDISEATREAVLKVALAAGYERNRLAVCMRSGRSGLLGIVIHDIANPFWAEVARGAQDRAQDAGSSLMIFSSDWDHDLEAQHLRTLRQARVDGTIINPVADSFDDLHRFGLPFVLIGSSAERFPETSSVGSDIAHGVRLGLDYLVAKGHQRPWLLLGPRWRIARARFLRTVHDHCVERDVDPSSLPMEEGEYTVEGGRQAMLRILEQDRSRHICVFAANDLMAIGCILAAREAGRSCPEEVSILGFDGIPAGAFAWPGLTTVEKPARALGRRSVECLLDELEGPADHGRVYLPCRLVERSSVADLVHEKHTQQMALGTA